METLRGLTATVFISVVCICLWSQTEGRCSVDPSQLPKDCSCPGEQIHILQCTCPSTNKMTELPPKEQIPNDVTFLIFLNCRFHTINKVEYTNLHSLHILNSIITTISGNSFANMGQLETLDLSNNELSDLPKDAFVGLDSVKTLTAPGNTIKQLSADAFENLPMLEKLDLSDNHGLQLPDTIFDKTPNLKTLEIRRCGFNDIPTAVKNVASLSELDLDLNSLQSLQDGDLSSMKNLITLGLDSCAIESISDGAFDSLHQLQVLNLGHNHLKSINRRHFEAFRDNLEYLYIENNELQTLSEDVLNWDNVKDSVLGHNPWVCDCRINWITEKLASKHNKENVTCSEPEVLAGKSLFNVTGHLSCKDQGKKSAVALAIAIPIIIICCLLIGYYAYKIYQNKKKGQRKSVRYSAVYKDTVESAKFRPSPDI